MRFCGNKPYIFAPQKITKNAKKLFFLVNNNDVMH